MTEISHTSRQPLRSPWTLDRLNRERSILLGLALDHSTALSYTSALNSYLTFCKIHHLEIEPTPETLSYYVTFQCTFITPSSVDTYLSGICSQLEPFFPFVRANRASQLVSRTLKGARRRHGSAPTRKAPLTWEDLNTVAKLLTASSSYDERLFVAMLLAGFCALLRLAELVLPDTIALRNFAKVTLRSSCTLNNDHFSFWLPVHKSDALFEGNKIVVLKRQSLPDPWTSLRMYLEKRDARFPLHPYLWLTEAGQVPTRGWFIARLRKFFPPSISGHSMRAGGATAMAEEGAAPELIKAAGRWTSNSFERYIRKNPVLLHALILGRTAGVHGRV